MICYDVVACSWPMSECIRRAPRTAMVVLVELSSCVIQHKNVLVWEEVMV